MVVTVLVVVVGPLFDGLVDLAARTFLLDTLSNVEGRMEDFGLTPEGDLFFFPSLDGQLEDLEGLLVAQLGCLVLLAALFESLVAVAATNAVELTTCRLGKSGTTVISGH